MRRILIVDTETTGIDPASSRVIELAWAVWLVKERCLLEATTQLIFAPENQAEHVNGIPVAALEQGWADDGESSVWEVAKMAATECDAYVAHGAEFDRKMIDGRLGDYCPWICSMEDIAWPKPSSSRSLVGMALAHGVGVVSAHRALDDVMTLCRLFERVAELGHDVDKMLTDALLPRITLQALQKFEDNDKAKAHGFRFDGGTKRWLKRVRKDQPGEYPFRIREVQP